MFSPSRNIKKLNFEKCQKPKRRPLQVRKTLFLKSESFQTVKVPFDENKNFFPYLLSLKKVTLNTRKTVFYQKTIAGPLCSQNALRLLKIEVSVKIKKSHSAEKHQRVFPQPLPP